MPRSSQSSHCLYRQMLSFHCKMALAAEMSVTYKDWNPVGTSPPTFNPCYSFPMKPIAEMAKEMWKTWPRGIAWLYTKGRKKSIGKLPPKEGERRVVLTGPGSVLGISALPSFCLHPWIVREEDAAPCHHCTGIRIVTHEIVYPQTSPLAFQPACWQSTSPIQMKVQLRILSN